MPNNNQTRTTFNVDEFTALAIENQQLLQLLAIIYLPIASTPLAQCVSKANINDPETQTPWTNRSIKLSLNKLAKQGWVVVDSNRFGLPKALIEDITLYALKENNFNSLAETIQAVFTPKQAYSGKRVWSSWEAAVADARMHLYQGDQLTLKTILADIHSQFQYIRQHHGADPLPDILGTAPKREQLEILNDEIFISSVAPFYTSYAAFQLDNIDEFWEEMLRRKETVSDEAQANILNTQIAAQCLVRGDTKNFPDKPQHLFYAALWQGSLSARQLMQGDNAEAIDTYDKGIRLLRKSTKERGNVFQRDIFEALHFLNLLSSGTGESVSKTIVAHNELSESFVIYYLLIAYADLLTSGDDKELKEEINLLANHDDSFILLFSLLINYWAGLKTDTVWIDKAIESFHLASTNGYLWFAAEFAEALARHLPDKDDRKAEYAELSQELHQQIGTKTLFNLVSRQNSWERSLNALNILAQTKTEAKTNERLIWILHEGIDFWSLHPKVQKQTKSGGWSKGRNVPANRLLNEQDDMPYLSEEDLHICATAIVESRTYGAYPNEYEIDIDRAWPALINHPRVFWDKTRTTPLEIMEGDIELLVTEEGDEIRVTIYPEIKKYQLESQSYIIGKETPTRLRVYKINDEHEQIVSIIGDGLLLPKEAEAQLRETLSTLAPMMNIQSDIAGVDNAEEIPSDPMIHVHLLPYGDGLRLSLRVQPFGNNNGPIYPPGHGRKNLLIEIDGQKTKLRRDLDEEMLQAQNLQDHVEMLADWQDLDNEIVLEEAEEALEALTGLHEMGDSISIEWPEGEFMRVNSTLGANNMRLSINEKGEWFELEGEVEINEDLILSLGQLLELTQNNNSRFIKMSDGQYVALSRNLKKKLQAVSAYAEKGESEESVRLSGLASLALEDFLDEVSELEGDGKWKEHINNIKDIQDKHYEVPSTLQAELRDYQIDGFRWLARLADWGVGACLADDMGLGKTLQSLALILTRASQGPTLVIAPVSVCNNWHSETEKFAPTLTPIFYRGKNRRDLLKDLKPFDLVICSYGLLPQDADVIGEINWTTALLDEAQAIKNIGTKRTKAAWNITADFKMITTGTPIENHLGELWSLFRYLNPGLLGTQDHFTRMYMAPIERFKDKDAAFNLRSLIQPFMLRRLKSDVLQELPPRTEITHSVPLSKEERALYEAVRQKAIKKFSSKAGQENNNTNPIQILAEITKLRLASCHPKLIMENSPLPGSKLQAFGEILEELLDNHHKALVFSQFVKHLSILREYLDEQGINYQYLDGSTPQAKRKIAVDDFQNGKGDVFLISLKAGGSGLNLTAADYVIHMDPWWNPAVEDQASDRAHRIGQQRPVTIYRLVAENTIEEKIIKLHQRKRDLADNLLEGSDISGKMDAKEMLRLIKET